MTVQKIYTPVIENIVNIIGNVVDNVQAEYDLISSEKPYFEHGHPLEIINTLKEKTADDTLKFKKFPLIALFEDFEMESQSGVFKSSTKLNILFITDTDKNYKAADRYTNSFDAILTPIYTLFKKHLLRQKGVHVLHKTIDHNAIYHLYWGKKGLYGNDGNIFDDHIDAIELRGLDVKIYR